jgi:hypothetical protein
MTLAATKTPMASPGRQHGTARDDGFSGVLDAALGHPRTSQDWCRRSVAVADYTGFGVGDDVLGLKATSTQALMNL